MLRADLTYRHVLLDGRPLPKDPNPTWMGYSVGHWEGDTLVIESAGFTEQTWLDLGGHPHSENLRIVERYTRTRWGHIDGQVTFEDRAIYAKPWTVPVSLELRPDDELLEYNCRENEKSRAHFVGKMSDGAVRVPVETLQRYVGRYEARRGSLARVYDFRIVGDELTVAQEGGARTALIPTSETTFGLFRFAVDAQGNVEMWRSAVEGEEHGVRLK